MAIRLTSLPVEPVCTGHGAVAVSHFTQRPGPPDSSHVEVGHAVRMGPGAYAAGQGAAAEALSSLRLHRPSVVLVFASVQHDLDDVLRGVRSVTGDAPLVGASGSGEIRNGEHHGSVVVAAIGSPFLSVRVGTGEAVSSDWRVALRAALSSPALGPFFDGTPRVWAELARRGRSAFALVLSPGTTRHAISKSYEILEELKRRTLGRMPIFGASAGDDWELERNYVFEGGRAMPDGLVVAIVETELEFGTAWAHGFRAAGPRLTATEVEGHEVLAFDGLPAAEAYARLLGTTRAALEGQHLTVATARILGVADPFGNHIPNAASYFTPRGGVHFGRAVVPGTVLWLLEVGPDTALVAGRESVGKAMLRGGMSSPALVLIAYCALRHTLLGEAARGEIPRLVQALGGAPVVGLCSFGEQGPSDDGAPQHTNGVIGALVLGSDLSQTALVARENEALRREVALAHRRTQEELERQVADRTAQLRAANELLQAEIAERRHAEAEREHATARLLEGDRLSSIGTLAAGLAHEINNPLAVVKANLGYVLEEMRRPERSEQDATLALEEALQGVDRVAKIVRDLRTFSRPDGGGRETTDLVEVVQSSMNVARNEARHRARVMLDLQPVPRVAGSPPRIGQVFLNLLRNAIQAIALGRADENEIRISTRAEGDRVLLSVADTGCGITPENLPRVFEPFFTTQPPGAGTGLGLPICHGIVTGLGGEITVRSAPGQGTTFEVSLPVARGGERSEVAPLPSTPVRARVLVVDDEPMVVRAMERILSPQHEVVGFTSARAALERLAHDSAFDVVLCDLMMPEMTGMELHARLAAAVPELAQRTLFVTGGAFSQQAQEFLDGLGNRSVAKPFAPDVLRALVSEVASRSR